MYRALLVCNSVFPEDPAGLPRLNGPRKDGLVLWRALTDDDCGLFSDENVQVIYERSSQETLESVEDFLASAESDDVCLLYYSGHGRRHGRELILCSRNTRTARLQATGVSCSILRRIVENSHARTVIVILDCCYGAAFKGEPSADILAGQGVYVISASGPTELADDATEGSRPSPFTKALAESLTRADVAGDQGLSLDTLHDEISSKIVGRQPKPWKRSDGSGIVRIAGPRPSEYKSERATFNRADIERLDDFDKLIADIGKPTPKFGSVQRLLEMGPGLYEGCVRIITSICPGEGDMLGDMRANERRLAARIRSILVQRMPESGNAISHHIKLLVNSGKFVEASRLIRFMDRDLLVPMLVPTYQDLVESGQFPRSAGQLLEDAIKKYSLDPSSWRLDELKINGGAWLDVILEGLNLTGAEINSARFYHCRFTSCNITKSKFVGCTFSDFAFDGSDLSGTTIAGQSSRDRTYMTGVSLKNCTLRGATFRSIFTFFEVGRRGREAHLPKKEERIHFGKSDLSEASFLDCDLRGADFSECRGVEKIKDCSNTRLYGSVGLSQSTLEVLIQRGAINEA